MIIINAENDKFEKSIVSSLSLRLLYLRLQVYAWSLGEYCAPFKMLLFIYFNWKIIALQR